ncbi:unnamed protein product, partial [Urochloa humidicola]
ALCSTTDAPQIHTTTDASLSPPTPPHRRLLCGRPSLPTDATPSLPVAAGGAPSRSQSSRLQRKVVPPRRVELLPPSMARPVAGGGHARPPRAPRRDYGGRTTA